MYADFLCYNYEPASGYGASYPIPELWALRGAWGASAGHGDSGYGGSAVFSQCGKGQVPAADEDDAEA